MMSCYSRWFLAAALLLIGSVVIPHPLFAQCISPPSGIVAWWSLDEAVGPTANDMAGSVNNSGTWTNGPVPVAGMVAGGLSFSGTNSVDVPDHAEVNFGTGDFTIDLWIKTTNSSGTRTILDKRTGTVPNISGYLLFMFNGNLSSQIGDGTGYNNCVTTGFIADGNWHHIALTVDRNSASGWRHYVDGNLLATIGNPTAYQGSMTNTAPFVMGRNLLSAGSNFAGTLDEVDLFNRELDSLEIRSIWNAGSSGKCKTTCSANGDADNDGTSLTVADLNFLAAFINDCGPIPPVLHSCNLNGDGFVDTMDIRILQDYFTFGLSVFAPYGGYPVPCPCEPVPSPVPDTVKAFGLEHTSLGVACLTKVGDTLKVTRMDVLERDGVKISVPDQYSSWNSVVAPLDPDGTLPDSASIMVDAIGRIDGVNDVVIHRMGSRKVGDMWELCADFSPVGATAFTIEIYSGKQLVHRIEHFTGQSGEATQATIGAQSPRWIPLVIALVVVVASNTSYHSSYWTHTYDGEGHLISSTYHEATYDFGSIVQIQPAGDTIIVRGDELRIIPENFVTQATGPLTLEITSHDIPTLSFVSEKVALQNYGISISPLGDATVAPVDTTLVISNIGSGGSDGMDAAHDEDEGEWSIVVANPDPLGTLPIGASIQAELNRYESILSDSTCLSMSKAAANTWNLAVQSRGTTYTVKAFNNGSQVFSGSDNGVSGLGSIVETAKGVYPVAFKGSSTGKPASVIVKSDYDFTASPDGVLWTWAAHGVANLTIDYLNISTELAGPNLAGISHAELCGANGDKGDPISFTVLDIVFTPSYLCGDADGNGIITISDAVYLINYIFAGGPAPSPLLSGDADCNGIITVSDAVYLINYIFSGGPAPCAACP